MKTPLNIPAIHSYHITWKVGGNDALGFLFHKRILASDCIPHKTRVLGVQDELHCVINDLSSGVPYEFKVAAENEVGIGEWSELSRPFVLHNPSKVPTAYCLNKLILTGKVKHNLL